MVVTFVESEAQLVYAVGGTPQGVIDSNASQPPVAMQRRRVEKLCCSVCRVRAEGYERIASTICSSSSTREVVGGVEEKDEIKNKEGSVGL